MPYLDCTARGDNRKPANGSPDPAAAGQQTAGRYSSVAVTPKLWMALM